jgi:predicted MFS family arabinose efflux permease
LAGLAALEASLFARATWLFLAGTVVSGIAVGLVFRGGLSEISRLAEPGRRAEAMSAFFAAAYLGISLPVVLIGLISQLISTVDASAWVAGLLAVLIVAATVIVTRTFGKTPPASLPAGDDHPASVPPGRRAPGAE